MKLTEYGKYTRSLRLKNNELIMDMSNKLGITPSQLCAMEIGKEEFSDEIKSKINELYK